MTGQNDLLTLKNVNAGFCLSDSPAPGFPNSGLSDGSTRSTSRVRGKVHGQVGCRWCDVKNGVFSLFNTKGSKPPCSAASCLGVAFVSGLGTGERFPGRAHAVLPLKR